ncbi:PQQ-dependent sugar dehydrogenase [Tamlana fucoidanivorans]|uniref:PQQ-dependent sugar dehydrogenase n=1 Tax=Allotamlana fucoidanivorans TaxID=2583814 RepID=A0A5C4SPA5_9FLAO|nr:PQQ-dependent sugar dehydrogenase [Tamlana fucoidanivorans]TNJ46102.1 PQQ-dependent sugar dehydrogenase [Tamlana fucoidanivorans]
MRKSISLLTLILITCATCAQQTESEIKAESPVDFHYTTELIVPELNIPWGMAFLPDNSILITEKSGELILFKDNKKTIIQNPPNVYVRGQGGLLDIALHPDYENTGWIYMSYASSEDHEEGGNTALARAKLNNNTLVDFEVLYKAEPNTKKGQHWGSRISFDNDGHIYFSIGDRGNRDENPQDITKDGGKIYRLNDDGSIPSDNPFINTQNAKKAIYSYGHRNPQGMTKHPVTGAIYVNEHGPKGGDEINIIAKGKNYGWPVISYGINYNGTPFTDITEREGMEQPLFYWVPSIAPCGFVIVNSNFYPEWRGNFLVGSLKFQYLERLVVENNQVIKREKLFEHIGRVRNIKQAPNGYLYMAVEGQGIFKIIPNQN